MQPPENDDSRSTGPLPRYLTPDFYAELAKHRRRHPVAEKVKRALRKREDYLELGQRQAALRDGLESELSPELLW